MRTLQMQYSNNGEWFDIWETSQAELMDAWNEMDIQPTEGGRIRFQNGDKFLVVNGGARQ